MPIGVSIPQRCDWYIPGGWWVVLCSLVSIPQRCDWYTHTIPYRQSCTVFQFLKGAIDINELYKSDLYFKLFQFLKGAIDIQAAACVLKDKVVSIPQRCDWYKKDKVIIRLVARFNSSKVRLIFCLHTPIVLPSIRFNSSKVRLISVGSTTLLYWLSILI